MSTMKIFTVILNYKKATSRSVKRVEKSHFHDFDRTQYSIIVSYCVQ